MDIRILMKFTALTVAMVLTAGVAGAAEDYIVAGSPGTAFRVAQAADQQPDGKPQVSEEDEAVLGQNAGPEGKCDPALHADGACPHMKDGKCEMADGDCPHMQHGEGGMSGDMAHHGGGHKCQMADGACPHMKDGKCEMADGDCPHMQHGKDQMSGEDKPTGDDKE